VARKEGSIMLKIQLPLFPPELTFVNKEISYQKKDGQVYYFHGFFPLFFHEEKDLKSFRFISSQLVVSGRVKQIEISRAFGVSYISVKRSVKLLREKGPEGFFKKAKARSPHILIPDVVEKAQKFLDKGDKPEEVARKLDLKANTVRKAIQDGRLRKREQDNEGKKKERGGSNKK
jgi:hypothetical protein